jgi:hypothetical protein
MNQSENTLKATQEGNLIGRSLRHLVNKYTNGEISDDVFIASCVLAIPIILDERDAAVCEAARIFDELAQASKERDAAVRQAEAAKNEMRIRNQDIASLKNSLNEIVANVARDAAHAIQLTEMPF